MNKVTKLLAFIIIILTSLPLLADDEASNVAHIATGKYGRCYAKSVPKYTYDPDDKRQQGETRIYRVENKKDILIDTYNWFSQRVFLACSNVKEGSLGTSIVRIGPWHRGSFPKKDHLAIAFYFNGKLLKKYSTLDIAGENVPIASSSHYRIFKNISGFKWDTVNRRWKFHVNTFDNREVVFDPKTGDIFNSR